MLAHVRDYNKERETYEPEKQKSTKIKILRMLEIVLLENSHHLGGTLAAKCTQRCTTGHDSRMCKVKRRGDKELSHDSRDCPPLGSLEIARDRAQEYRLRWTEKCQHCPVEREIELLFSRIRLWWKKRCLCLLLEGYHVPIRSFVGEGIP